MKKYFLSSLVLILATGAVFLPNIVFAGNVARTIVNPANNSPLSSSVMRNELQILENEVNLISNALWSGMGSTTPSGVLVGNGTANVTSTLSPSVASILATTTLQSDIANNGGTFDISQFSGADIGAQTNTAYAALPSGGGALFEPSGIQTYSTGISFGTSGKFGLIKCASGGGAPNNADGGTTLKYTGTTGTSTAFNILNAINAGAIGIENCNLEGTNGTTARITDGVFFGGTNGAFSAYLQNVNVSGFGTGVSLRPSTSFNSIINSTIHFNGRNISEPDTSGANCENMRILNSVISDANNQLGGATDLKGLYVQESGNCQWNIVNTSIDDNQIYADQFGGTANIWSLVSDHQENPDGHTYPMIGENAGGSTVVMNLIGGDMMNDVTGGQPDQIEAIGNVNLIGFTSDANNNVTIPVTRIVNALASSTQIDAFGLVCKGANKGSFTYGNVPCGPVVVGSDYGAPSLYVATSSTQGIGTVGIGTSSPSALFGKSVVNLGLDSVAGISNSASSTVTYTGIGQMQFKNTSGTTVCMFVVGTTPTVSTGACNH